MTLVFDMALEEDLSDTPTRPDFYFKMVINSAPETCPIIGGVVIDGNTITLTFETGAEAGDVVWLEYDNFSINAPIESVTARTGRISGFYWTTEPARRRPPVPAGPTTCRRIPTTGL